MALPGSADAIREACRCPRASCACKRPSGNVHCPNAPAHRRGDATPSLSVKEGSEGKTVLKCHGGCKTPEVVRALGLEMRDLSPRPRQQSGEDGPDRSDAARRVVATYNYTDEAGATVYQVLRYEPKGFRQRRPDGRGGWLWSLGDTRPVPFHLPDVLAAASDGQVIYIVEGEKDADRLMSAGVVATCNSGGAGKWRADFARYFVGALNVTVVADRDEPGYRHAAAVLASLSATGIPSRIVEAATGKDVSDHLDAGHGLQDLVPVDLADHGASVAATGVRHVSLTRASDIAPRPVKWLAEERIPLGALTLLAGREGIGKTTATAGWIADITRGRMRGAYFGEPHSVIIAATEDSWAQVIVPRLMAADADLDRVFRVNVVTSGGSDGFLSLPDDIQALEEAIGEVGAVAVVLDPLLSRLDASLDSHKDAEVRVALEPLVALADRTRAAFLGLIHLNKSSTADPLTQIMGSRAFAAVARAVIMFARDPDDERTILVGVAKSNLGRSDLPTLRMQVESRHVVDTDEGPVWSSRAVWLGESTTSIREAMADIGVGSASRTATADAAAWLSDYLESAGGTAASAVAKRAGHAAGHSESALQRARERLRITTTSKGFPRQTHWSLPVVSGDGESAITEITGTTALTETSGVSGFSPPVPPARTEQLGLTRPPSRVMERVEV